MQTYHFYKKALNELPKPCLFLDIDILQQNITDIAGSSNHKRIRIASKSIRSVGVLKEIFNMSSIFNGIMCYTAEEAIYLTKQGFDDLLIAYPVWNSNHLHQIARLLNENHTITMMVDSIAHIDRLEKIAKEVKAMFLVCIDIDLSSDFFGLHFGVHRSPIKTTEHAMAIVNRIHDSSHLQMDGVMGYEAQIAGVTDNDPEQKIKNRIIRLLKKQSSKELMQKRTTIIEAIKAKGISLRFVNGGGTGSLHQTSREKHVTEVTVGSGFFNPHLFDNYINFQCKPALLFAIEVTRIPDRNIYTCFGGGYIASGATGNDRSPKVYLPKGARLTSNEGAGEVQTPVFYNGDIPLENGDPIIMRHSKAGELCEHFRHIYLLKNGKVIGNYATYRGDQQCFL